MKDWQEREAKAAAELEVQLSALRERLMQDKGLPADCAEGLRLVNQQHHAARVLQEMHAKLDDWYLRYGVHSGDPGDGGPYSSLRFEVFKAGHDDRRDQPIYVATYKLTNENQL